MSIDIEAIKGRIANGVYGDDRLTGAEVFDALAALDELVAEVERLREFRNNALHAGNDEVAEAVAEERAAVVAWLRKWGGDRAVAADDIERGEHREEKE